MLCRSLIAIACGLAAVGLAAPALAQNTCPGFQMGYVPVSGDTTGDPVSGAASCGSSNGTPANYYNFTAPCSGTYRLATCGSAYDTVISVHTGCPADTSNQIACNDDNGAICGGNGLQSSLDVALTAGTFYVFRVSGFNGRTGAYTLSLAPLDLAAPSNDSCANAIPMISNTAYNGNNACATRDGDANCNANYSGDVWYSFSPGCTGTYTFSTCGSSFDTLISVHTGCPGDLSNIVGCNDDSCGLQSNLAVNLNGGATYLVRVTGFAGGRGDFTLSVSSASFPANDACANAIPIGIGTGVASGSTACATQDGAPGCRSSSGDVWYSFTPVCDGTYTLESCGSGFDTVLSIHSGCPGTPQNAIACNDDSCGLQSRVSAVMTGGQTYLLRVGGFAGRTGDYTLNLVRGADTFAANDSCGAAIPMSGGVTYFGDTRCASSDGAATCAGAGVGTADLWYSFRPPCNGSYLFTMCGSGYDTALSLHSGCPGDASNILACNDDSCGLQSQIQADLSANTTYLVRVAGFLGRTGPFRLTVLGGPDNDGCQNATVIPPAGGTFTGSTSCATNDGSANCASSAASPDVWYAFTPTCSGFIGVDTEGSNYDTALSVHSGCPGTIANEIACDDDGGTGLLSRIVFPAVGGTTYLIRVNGFANRRGDYTLNVTTVPNDSCGNAIRIGIGNTPYTNIGASTDGPNNVCAGLGSDVWYRHRSSNPGIVQISTCGTTNYDSAIAIYDSTTFNCGAGAPVACVDDSCGLQTTVRYRPAPGRDYIVRVGGFIGRQGCGNLNIQQFCPADIDDGSGLGVPDGGVTIDDLLYFLELFAQGNVGADVDDGSGTGTPDGGVTIEDLLYFLGRYNEGC